MFKRLFENNNQHSRFRLLGGVWFWDRERELWWWYSGACQYCFGCYNCWRILRCTLGDSILYFLTTVLLRIETENGRINYVAFELNYRLHLNIVLKRTWLLPLVFGLRLKRLWRGGRPPFCWPFSLPSPPSLWPPSPWFSLVRGLRGPLRKLRRRGGRRMRPFWPPSPSPPSVLPPSPSPEIWKPN